MLWTSSAEVVICEMAISTLFASHESGWSVRPVTAAALRGLFHFSVPLSSVFLNGRAVQTRVCHANLARAKSFGMPNTQVLHL